MAFNGISLFLLIIATGLILLGFKVLFAKGWFLNFLRGFTGFGAIFVAIYITLFGVDLASYAQLKQGEVISNISFTKVGIQQYEAEVANVITGELNTFTIYGDLFQVDARILKVALVGTPFYMLERLSGRYYSIEQERNNTRNVYQISGSSKGYDIWDNFNQSNLGLISAKYGSATYAPMADGAMFSVQIGVDGLKTKPVNEAANIAVNDWQ